MRSQFGPPGVTIQPRSPASREMPIRRKPCLRSTIHVCLMTWLPSAVRLRLPNILENRKHRKSVLHAISTRQTVAVCMKAGYETYGCWFHFLEGRTREHLLILQETTNYGASQGGGDVREHARFSDQSMPVSFVITGLFLGDPQCHGLISKRRGRLFAHWSALNMASTFDEIITLCVQQ